MSKRIVIVGAGISGLSIAHFLSTFGSVQVLEKSEKPGGLIKCDIVSDNLFHKVGGHVFNAKNQEVLNWFWSHFDIENEFVKARRNAKILIHGKQIGYPIENFLYELDKKIIHSAINDFIEILSKGNQHKSEYENFESFLKGRFGETLYNLYFKPYNTKLWNTDLSEVPLEWLQGKLPMPNIQDILLNNILKQEENEMVHSTFYYPVQGGSQFIADRLAENINIVTGYSVDLIDYSNGKYIINGDLEADVVVYTGDIRKLHLILKVQDSKLEKSLKEVSSLPSNGTSNMLCECDDNDLSWLYIPEPFTKAHRIIYTGNFSPNNSKGTNRKTCVVEFSGKTDPEEMKQEIKKLPGNLSYLAHNYEPDSYIINKKDTPQKVEEVKKLLASRQFYLLGRFAEWEYYNMDKAIEAAINLSKSIMQL